MIYLHILSKQQIYNKKENENINYCIGIRDIKTYKSIIEKYLAITEKLTFPFSK